MTSLSEPEVIRYNRQMMVAGWGEEGQEKLKESTVFIAGMGGLGCPVSIYLAVAGVGHMRICDADRIELSNLNRQIHYSEEEVGRFKAESAEVRLRGTNPEIDIVSSTDLIDAENIGEIAGEADLVIDCLDNFETRYLLNGYCIEKGIPLVHGAVWGLSGQVTFLRPPATPCLQCIFPEPPPKSVFPVVGATPGLTGCLQAMEGLKYLTGVGRNVENRLLMFDGEEMDWRSFKVRRRPDCSVCGRKAR